MSRPWAPVHPQHGADSRGGCGRAYAALGASFSRRGRPLAPVDLMGGTEELGVPQLRERHVRRTRYSKKISFKVKATQPREEAGGEREREKKRESKNPQKEDDDEGGV